MSQSNRKKEDADKLLESVKEKAKNPREIQLKGFHIASLYSQAKEHRTALHHALNYVSVKPNDVRAHRLLGEIYEALMDTQKAIDSYRRALELNDTQKDIVLKVAELYCHVDYDSERHKFWAERAEKYFPGNPKIYNIMEHIYHKNGKLDEFKSYLYQRMKSHPQDLTLNLKLLQVLIDLRKMKEAQQLCTQVMSAKRFDLEPQWWKKVYHLYQMYLSSVDNGDGSADHINAFCHMLLCINKMVNITLSIPNNAVTQASKLLRVMDKDLLRASDFIEGSKLCPEQCTGRTFVQEMKAQLYTHLATLLIKMSCTSCAHWADVIGIITACYLVSAQVSSCDQSTQRDDKSSTITNRVYSLAQCRLSEVCHILTSIVKEQKDDQWLKSSHVKWCSEEGRQLLLSQAFGQGGVDSTSSFLAMDESLVNAKFVELPSLIKTVFVYDQESIKCEPGNLQRLVWLGVQWNIRQDGILPDLGQFLQPSFSRLLFSTQHLENTSVDNVRLLDIEAFLYCCVYMAKTQLEYLQARSQNVLPTLPLGLHRGICSQQQVEWYTALYCLYTAKASCSERHKMRLIVQRGLEVLRCRMNHGMETSLLICLGRTFRERMQEVQKSSKGDESREQWNGFQQMSVMYWEAALDHLHMLERNQAIPTQQKPFFLCGTYGSRPILAENIQQYQDEGTVAVAEYKFQQGQFQQAVTMLDKTKSATGSYLKAQMYLTKAQTDVECQGLEVNSSPLSRKGNLLDKAKYALFETMDYIQNQPNNPLHEQVQTSLSDIDHQIAVLSHQVAEVEQDESALDTSLKYLDIGRNISISSDVTTPQDGGRKSIGNDPSPRRLAAELRSLNLSHGRLMEENTDLRSLAATHSRILEQNQKLIENQSDLMESNNALMKQVLELNMKFQELSTAQANRIAASPSPAQQQGIPDTINSNRPIIISAQECKIDNPNLSASQLGSLHPMMPHAGIASPMHGISSPIHTVPAAPLSGLYHHPAYGYYPAPAQGYGIASYDTSALHPTLITSTPAMHRASVPVAPQYMMYDDITSPNEVETEDQITCNPLIGKMTSADTQSTTSFKASVHVQLDEGGNEIDEQFSHTPQQAKLGEISNCPSTASSAKPVGSFSSPLAKSQDVAGSSPLLMSMLMTKDTDTAASSPSKAGSITAGTPPNFTNAPTKSSILAPGSTMSTLGQNGKDTESIQSVFSSQNTISQPGSLFSSSTNQDSASSFEAGNNSGKSTILPSTTISASSHLSSFSFKPSEPFSRFTQPKSTTVTLASTSAKMSTQQTPFAGFSFGQIKPAVTPSTSFGGFSTSSPQSFHSVAKQSQHQQEQEVVGKDDDDDVVIVSVKMPTPEQRARAEQYLLPPAFFLYEDDPPCPGCIGCDPEDLAARGVTLSESGKPTDQVVKSGNTMQAQQIIASVATEPLSSTTKSGAFGTKEPSPPSVFGNAGESSLSFASLSSNKHGTFAEKDAIKGFAFARAGAQVFGKTSNEETGEVQEYDPHFEPIMSLPELVDIKTGEEDEEVMYKQRARLYRYVKDLGVWKERGIGDVKLLQHKDTGALRLIMRREQVLKLCANHRITPNMTLDTLMSSDRTWVWHALDYSEEEPCHQQFALKFKTPELAHEFKHRLEELQALRKEEEEKQRQEQVDVSEGQDAEKQTGKEGEKEITTAQEESVTEVKEQDQESFCEDVFAKFQPEPGAWKCDSCWVMNKKDDVTCVACTAPKPGSTPPKMTTGTTFKSTEVTKPTATSIVLGSELKFGISSGGGFTFGGSSGSTAKSLGFQFGQSNAFSSAVSKSTPEALVSSGPIVFGAPKSDTASKASEEKTQQFTFGSGFQKFDLGGAGDKTTPLTVPVQSPSTGFTFGSSNVSSSKGDDATTEGSLIQTQHITPVKQTTGYVFGGSTETSSSSASEPSKDKSTGFSFSDMAKSEGSMFSFRLDVSKTSEVCPPKSPIKPESPDVKKSPGLNKSVDTDYYKDDDGDHIHFDPVVELPECVEVKTGEEDEVAKFSHRAKLFRFDKDSSQWKERGIGDIKLLYNSANKKYRIVMRREQVLKVCANHYVTPELSLKPNAGSTKSWVWMAMDASEEEVQIEQLAVRFKTEEVAQEFKHAIDAAQEDIKTIGIQLEKKEDQNAQHADEVKKEGQQEHEDIEPNEKDTEEGGGNRDVVEDDHDKDEDRGDLKKGNDQGQDKDEHVSTEEDSDDLVKSCDPSISLAFSELLRSANASHTLKQKDDEIPNAASVTKDEDAGISKNESISEDRDDIHFEPIAHLPEQLETITGEEDEDQLFCSRAKLYRYDKETSQWKDRGIGEIKILHNTKTGRYRIIMRREQVLKVCANHYITKEMSLHPNSGSENSLVWQAMDASDGDPQLEELAVRFKVAGTTQRFKTTFEKCQAQLRELAEQASKIPSPSVESHDISVDDKQQGSLERDDDQVVIPTPAPDVADE